MFDSKGRRRGNPQRKRVSYDSLASIVEKEYLNGDCNTLNSSFQLYNALSSSQKSQKQHFVMLFPGSGNKQHKVNKNIFEKGLMFFFKNNLKNKGPYFCFLLFCFNFL